MICWVLKGRLLFECCCRIVVFLFLFVGAWSTEQNRLVLIGRWKERLTGSLVFDDCVAVLLDSFKFVFLDG